MQTLAAIKALVTPVRDLHAESLSALDQDAVRLRLLQEEDRQALEDEVGHAHLVVVCPPPDFSPPFLRMLD